MQLEEWTREWFFRDNHPKYHHYFKEWFDSLSKNQLDGFTNQMNIKL